MSGFPNKPKILRGAFIGMELLIPPPLFVVFQFNPEQLTRSHSRTFTPLNSPPPCPPCEGQTEPRPHLSQESLRSLHMQADSLEEIRRRQQVSFQEESISFDIRLDASDQLNKGDPITQLLGLSPQIATLESMVSPKSDTPFGAIADLLTGGEDTGHRFNSEHERPPMVLFIWGVKRVLPVNITSMNITETEFSSDLSTRRATVSVSLTVIEGKNMPYGYTRAVRELMTTMNLANIADLTNIAIPA